MYAFDNVERTTEMEKHLSWRGCLFCLQIIHPTDGDGGDVGSFSVSVKNVKFLFSAVLLRPLVLFLVFPSVQDLFAMTLVCYSCPSGLEITNHVWLMKLTRTESGGVRLTQVCFWVFSVHPIFSVTNRFLCQLTNQNHLHFRSVQTNALKSKHFQENKNWNALCLPSNRIHDFIAPYLIFRSANLKLVRS